MRVWLKFKDSKKAPRTIRNVKDIAIHKNTDNKTHTVYLLMLWELIDHYGLEEVLDYNFHQYGIVRLNDVEEFEIYPDEWLMKVNPCGDGSLINLSYEAESLNKIKHDK